MIGDTVLFNEENKKPQVFENVKVEFGNGLPLTAEGKFRNFVFRTRRALAPMEKVYQLLDTFNEERGLIYCISYNYGHF